MTQDEYERAYSGYLYHPAHQFAAKWFSLARFSVDRFGLMKYGGVRWNNIDSRQRKAEYLATWGTVPVRKPETLSLVRFDEGKPDLRHSFYQFRQHLRGRLTLGIWPDLENSFTMIDLDGEQAAQHGELTSRLMDLHLHHCIEYSGSKGYHFWVFWDRVLTNKRLMELQNWLTDGLDVDRNVWPYKQGLIKLPLGVHRDTGNLACFVDYQGNPIPLDQQFEYFLGMSRNRVPVFGVEPDEHVDVAEEEKPSRPSQKQKKPKKQRTTKGATAEWRLSDSDCRRILDKRSCPVECSREALLFRLTTYLRNQGCDRDECKRTLREWSQCVSQRSRKELNYDVERQADAVYDRPDMTKEKLPELTAKQQQVLYSLLYDLLCTPRASLRGTGHRDVGQMAQAETTLRTIAEYLLRLILRHGGRCHVTFRTIAKHTGLNLKRVQKWLPMLCGEPWIVSPDDWPGIEIDGPEYLGTLFVRVELADHRRERAQAYRLSEMFAEALGLAVIHEPLDGVRTLRGAHLAATDHPPETEEKAPAA